MPATAVGFGDDSYFAGEFSHVKWPECVGKPFIDRDHLVQWFPVQCHASSAIVKANPSNRRLASPSAVVVVIVVFGSQVAPLMRS